MRSLIQRHGLFALTLAIAILFLAGWLVLGDSSRTGTISGTVTFKGQPLPGGMVTLFSTMDGDARTFPAQIHKDGTFTIANVPAGPAKVWVGTAPSRPIPRRFRDSGFSFEVKPGTQGFRIDID